MANEYQNEIAVIGSMLISPEVYGIADGVLTAYDFGNTQTQLAYGAIKAIADDGKAIDPLLVAEQMCKMGGNDGVTVEFLTECMNVTPTAVNISEYVRLVKEQSTRRRTIEIAEEMQEAAANHADVVEIIQQAQQAFEDMGTHSDDLITGDVMARAWLDSYAEAKENPEASFCKTGYPALDKRLGGGLINGGLYIVGARPGMGKTTLGVNIAENVAMRGKQTLFVSLEMDRAQIMSKRISRQSGLNYTAVLTGQLKGEDEKKAIKSLNALSQHALTMTDRPALTVAKIGAAARSIKDLKLIVIDYLSLIQPADPNANDDLRTATTKISAELMVLAKRMKVPIIALCQLNRQQASRGAGSRPVLTDLRESGAIEQDAAGVIMLYRESYENLQKDPNATAPESEDIELIIAKHRHGQQGTVKLTWYGSTGLIAEGAPEYGI